MPFFRKRSFNPQKPILALFLFLALFLGAAWWLLFRETRRSIELTDHLISSHRAKLESELAGVAQDLQQLRVVSSSMNRADHLETAARSLLKQNPILHDFRVITADGLEILHMEKQRTSGGGVQIQTSRAKFDVRNREFFRGLKDTPEDSVYVSSFQLATDLNEKPFRPYLPVLRMGVPLYYPGGAPAGYLMTDIQADRLVGQLDDEKNRDFSTMYLMADKGNWIYNPKLEHPWQGLDPVEASAGMAEERNTLMRMVQGEDEGSVRLGGGHWVFQRHRLNESLNGVSSGSNSRIISPSTQDRKTPLGSSLFLLEEISMVAIWVKVALILIPLLILGCLSLIFVLPILRKRQAEEEERRKTLSELEEALFRTRLALEAARISEWRVYLKSGKVHADHTMSKLLKSDELETIRTVDHWIGKIHPDDRRRVQTKLNELEGGDDVLGTFRHRMQRGDGTWGWYGFRGKVKIWPESPDASCLYGTYLDLTETVEREEELQRLEMATNQSYSGVVILDRDGALEWANPAFCKKLGLSRADLVGKPVWESLKVINSAPEPAGQLRSSIYQGREFALTMSGKDEDGAAYWIRIQGNPVLDGNGVPAHFVVIETDITREKNIQNELEKNEMLLLESQRLANIGVWEWDCIEDTFFGSQKSREMLGIGGVQVPNMDFVLEVFQPKDRGLLRENMERAVQKGEGFEGQFQLIRDGIDSKPWIYMKGIAQMSDGATRKVFGIFQDISGQKRNEEMLAGEMQKTEQLQSRLNAIRQEARINEQRAIAANSEKTRFYEALANEIRKPLHTAIDTFADIELEHWDAEQKNHFQTIEASVRTLAGSLDDLLALPDMEHGIIELKQEKFSIQDILKDILAHQYVKARTKDLNFAVWFDPEAPSFVVGDSKYTRQVIMTAVDKSLTDVLRGFIAVELSLQERLPNDRCLIEILVAEVRKEEITSSRGEVFQPDQTLSADKQGVGNFSFTTAVEVANRMGGSILTEEDRDNSRSIRIRLPFAAIFKEARDLSSEDLQNDPEKPASDEPVTKRNETDIDPTSASAGPPRILVAEDNKLNQKVIQMLLKKLGHTAEIVDNGAMALQKAKAGECDIILMDIQMPQMDGHEAARKIRSEVSSDQRPWIIALTAGTSRDSHADAVESGMDGFIMKPVQREDLERELSKGIDAIRKGPQESWKS